MAKHPWIKWLLVLIGIVGLGLVLRFVLVWRELAGVARAVELVTIVLASIWCYLGLHWRRDRLWAGTQRTYLILSNATWLAALLAYELGRTNWAVNLMGIWSLIAIGLLGIWFITALVSAGNPITGIARTVIMQATRLHIVKVVIVAVVLMIILLPGALDAEERLNYRVTFYLVWSLRLATFLLSVMTAVLGCYTICHDLSRKQMYMLAAKPVARFQYLVGKWLGLVLLTVVLCAIVGVGVWLGARTLANEPLPNPVTPEAWRNQQIAMKDVLAARVTSYPVPGSRTNLQGLVEEQFETLKRESPLQLPEKLSDLDSTTRSGLQGKAIERWHTIDPRANREFYFEGFKSLADKYDAWAQRRGELGKRYEALMRENRTEEANALRTRSASDPPPIESLTLRLKPKYGATPDDGMLRLAVRIGGQIHESRDIPNDTLREINIPLHLIEPDGRVLVELANVDIRNPQWQPPSPIRFEPYEGLEMLYTAGTFEGNVVRGMVVHWVRLGFLAMLAIAAGTFLGFPMACLTSLFVYAIAVFSSFASESVDAYASFSVKDLSKWDVFMNILKGIWNGIITGEFWSIGKLAITLIGNIVLLIVPSFGYYNSTPLLSDGRMVSMELIFETLLHVGVIGTGVCLFIGWMLFRKKELATVTV